MQAAALTDTSAQASSKIGEPMLTLTPARVRERLARRVSRTFEPGVGGRGGRIFNFAQVYLPELPLVFGNSFYPIPSLTFLKSSGKSGNQG